MNECPGCGGPAMAMPFPLDGQAFCENDDCHVLMWNPDLSPAENMAEMSFVDLTGLDKS